MRNLEKVEELNEGVQLDEASKPGYHSSEEPQNSQNPYHRETSRSPTGKNKRTHDKSLVKEAVQGEVKEAVQGEVKEAVIKENFIKFKELNNTNTAETTDSIDANSKEWKKVLPRRKKNRKQIDLSKQNFKTDENGNESLSRNKDDRFISSERRGYSDNYQQKRVSNNVSDRKPLPQKKYSNLSKNGVHIPVQHSVRYSSNKSKNQHRNLDEVSAIICISAPNEKLSTVKSTNSRESVTEILPETSNAKVKGSRSKNLAKCQLKNESTFSQTNQHNKVLYPTTHKKENVFNNKNTADELKKKNNGLKPKKCNSKDKIAKKGDDCDILKNETIQQKQLNVHAEIFLPMDKNCNRIGYGMKNPKEQRKKMVVPNDSNIENLNDKITEYEPGSSQNPVSLNLIETENIEINTELISTNYETNNYVLNEPVANIPDHQFDQNSTCAPQSYGLHELSFNNEPQEYENEFTSSSNSDQREHIEPASNAFPGPLVHVRHNYFSTLLAIPATNLNNMPSQSVHFPWYCNGTVYFFPYPISIFGDDRSFMLFRNNRETNTSSKCPYC